MKYMSKIALVIEFVHRCNFFHCSFYVVVFLNECVHIDISIRAKTDQSLRLKKDFNPNLFVLERKTTTKRRM